MVTKSKKQTTGAKGQKKGRDKADKLKLNKETVKDLTGKGEKAVKGEGPGFTINCDTQEC